jgi:hypothetical protein
MPESIRIEQIVRTVQVAGSCAICSHPYSAGRGKAVIGSYYEDKPNEHGKEYIEDLFNLCPNCYGKHAKPGQKNITQYE